MFVTFFSVYVVSSLSCPLTAYIFIRINAIVQTNKMLVDLYTYIHVHEGNVRCSNFGVGGSCVRGSTMSPSAFKGQKVFLKTLVGSYRFLISQSRSQFCPKLALARSAGSWRPKNWLCIGG